MYTFFLVYRLFLNLLLRTILAKMDLHYIYHLHHHFHHNLTEQKTLCCVNWNKYFCFPWMTLALCNNFINNYIDSIIFKFGVTVSISTYSSIIFAKENFVENSLMNVIYPNLFSNILFLLSIFSYHSSCLNHQMML